MNFLEALREAAKDEKIRIRPVSLRRGEPGFGVVRGSMRTRWSDGNVSESAPDVTVEEFLGDWLAERRP